MPHVVVEYSDNIEAHADVAALLKLIAAHCADSGGVLPLAGIRVRAIRATQYVIADGDPDYGFVNVTVKLGQGRSAAFKDAFFGGLFERIKQALAPAMAARPVALSMYVEELNEDGAYRYNGVRDRLGEPQKGGAKGA